MWRWPTCVWARVTWLSLSCPSLLGSHRKGCASWRGFSTFLLIASTSLSWDFRSSNEHRDGLWRWALQCSLTCSLSQILMFLALGSESLLSLQRAHLMAGPRIPLSLGFMPLNESATLVAPLKEMLFPGQCTCFFCSIPHSGSYLSFWKMLTHYPFAPRMNTHQRRLWLQHLPQKLTITVLTLSPKFATEYLTFIIIASL